jgi:hypothetical protein
MKKIIEILKRKWPEYLIEILVITIGVLSAFMLNNWNESRKRENLKIEYLTSLQRDLKLDIVQLEQSLIYAENDLKINRRYSTRLSSANANIDTLIKIARNEFNPVVGGLKELNQNAYNALITTGNIDLLGKTLT